MTTLGANIRGLVPGCQGGTGVWVSYVRSELVPSNLNWMRVLLKAILKHEQTGHLVLTPVALSSLMQKWFVTVHPFADGNGRTSRAIQDLILEYYDLPFAPAGDLQNDALSEFEPYVELTYSKIEGMLSKLESCYAEYDSGKSVSFECKTTTELNN